MNRFLLFQGQFFLDNFIDEKKQYKFEVEMEVSIYTNLTRLSVINNRPEVVRYKRRKIIEFMHTNVPVVCNCIHVLYFLGRFLFTYI